MCEGLERARPTEEQMSSVREGLLRVTELRVGSACVSFIPRATRNQSRVLNKVTMW